MDDRTLQQMLDRVTMNEEFVVSVADIKAGRGLEAGKAQSITSANMPRKPGATSGKSQRQR